MEHEENTAEGWSDHAVETLLIEVKNYPALWDESHPDFTDVEVRNLALQEVISALKTLNIRTSADEILAKIESVIEPENNEKITHLNFSKQLTKKPPSWFTEAEFLRNARKSNCSQKEEAPPIQSGTTVDTHGGAREASASLFSNSSQITVEPLPSGSGRSHRKRMRQVEEEVDNSPTDNVTTRVLQPFSPEILERFNKIAPWLREEVEYEIKQVLNKYRVLSVIRGGSRGSSATSTPVSASPPVVIAQPSEAFPDPNSILRNILQTAVETSRSRFFPNTENCDTQMPSFFGSNDVTPCLAQPAVNVHPMMTSASGFFFPPARASSPESCSTQTPWSFGSNRMMQHPMLSGATVQPVTSTSGFSFPPARASSTESCSTQTPWSFGSNRMMQHPMLSARTVQPVTPESQFGSASVSGLSGEEPDSMQRAVTVQPMTSTPGFFFPPAEASSTESCNSQTALFFDPMRLMQHPMLSARTAQPVTFAPGFYFPPARASSTESDELLSSWLRVPSQSGCTSEEQEEDHVAKDRRTS